MSLKLLMKSIRKLKISADHTQETLVRINKKYEKREKNREASALKAA